LRNHTPSGIARPAFPDAHIHGEMLFAIAANAPNKNDPTIPNTTTVSENIFIIFIFFLK
jgi:hypothetical protein